MMEGYEIEGARVELEAVLEIALEASGAPGGRAYYLPGGAIRVELDQKPTQQTKESAMNARALLVQIALGVFCTFVALWWLLAPAPHQSAP